MQELVCRSVTPADLAEEILRFMGGPYSLRDYPMFRDIYNSPYQRKVMKAGRQVSKTVTMAGEICTDAATSPYTPAMYANSSAAQTTAFSVSKLDPFLFHSPVLYNVLMKSKHLINNIFNKRFANFSEIRLTYFSDSADRTRGTTAYRLYADEVQDMLYDALIDAEECLSAAPEPRFTYAGTSKLVTTTLEYMWTLSTQKEWIVRCESCGKWNRPSVDNIDLKGFVCKKCRSVLNTYGGRWHAFHDRDREPVVDGYWIPQIIMPLHANNPEKWADLLKKRENYPESKFLNEVMGLPKGEGDSPITRGLLQEACVDTLPMYERKCPENSQGAAYIVGGVDWGGGSDSSRTVLSIYAVYPESSRYVKIHGRIYDAGEPTKHVEDIARRLTLMGAIQVYCDHGGGNFANSQLAALVPNIRVVPVMYTEQSAPYRWDNQAGRFHVNRTVMIDAFLSDMKQGKVKCFRWSEFQPFAADILNVFVEVIGEEQGKGRRVWRHYPAKPDDSLHSMVFGWFGCRAITGRTDFRI